MGTTRYGRGSSGGLRLGAGEQFGGGDLVRPTTFGVDATTLEAKRGGEEQHVARHGEDYAAFLRLVQASGIIETPTAERFGAIPIRNAKEEGERRRTMSIGVNAGQADLDANLTKEGEFQPTCARP